MYGKNGSFGSGGGGGRGGGKAYGTSYGSDGSGNYNRYSTNNNAAAETNIERFSYGNGDYFGEMRRDQTIGSLISQSHFEPWYGNNGDNGNWQNYNLSSNNYKKVIKEGEFSKSVLAWIGEEGIGFHGIYSYFGYYTLNFNNISNSYQIIINAFGKTTASKFGNVDFFGTAKLFFNNQEIATSNFQIARETRFINNDNSYVGQAQFDLYSLGKIEVELDINYLIKFNNSFTISPFILWNRKYRFQIIP